MPDRDEEILDRLGSSAPELAREKDPLKPAEARNSDQRGSEQENSDQQSFDPYGSGNYKDPTNEWGQSDKTGWGNQGNFGNEGYYQGYESRNEDRTKSDEPMPDLAEKAHETTKKRDRG